MTEIYLHFLFAHYGLYGNAPVRAVVFPKARGERLLELLTTASANKDVNPWGSNLRVRGHIIGHARNNM